MPGLPQRAQDRPQRLPRRAKITPRPAPDRSMTAPRHPTAPWTYEIYMFYWSPTHIQKSFPHPSSAFSLTPSALPLSFEELAGFQPAPSFTYLTHPKPLARLLDTSWDVMNASWSVRRSSEPSWSDLSRPWRVCTLLGHVFDRSWTAPKSQKNKTPQDGGN